MQLKSINRLAAALLLVSSSAAFAADYNVDAGHSTVQFKIGHLGFSETVGRFNEFSGQYTFDADNLDSVAVSFEVKTGTIDSNHDARDKHLRSPDFFDAKQFPTMSFTSTGYQGTAEGGKLMGNLTLLGVTKPVTFDIEKIGEGNDPWGNYRSGFNASAVIDRGDFGMKYGLPGIPAETTVNLFIEGIRR